MNVISLDDGPRRKLKSSYRLSNHFFNCAKRGHRAEGCRSTKEIIEILGDAPTDKKGGGRGNGYVCGSEQHFAHIRCGM